MNLKILTFLLISPLLLYSQIDLDVNIFQLNEYNDKLTIKEVIAKESEGFFSTPFPVKTYVYITNKEANWICINVVKQKEKQYLSIENSLLEELRFYKYKDSKISIPEDLRDKKQYRYPIISITPEETPCKIFIRSKDALSFRTEFGIRNYNEYELQKTIQTDYFVIGAFTVPLFILLISACIFFVYKIEFAVLWYSLHIAFISIEFLIMTGIFSQYILSQDIITRYNLDHISLLLSVVTLSQFYHDFFPYTSVTKFCKSIYLFITAITSFFVFFALYDTYMGNIYNIEWYTQTVLIVGSSVSLVLHSILVLKKIIPIYILIGFLLPPLGVFANTGDFKEMFENPNITYFLYQSVYLGIFIQIIILIYYIIKQSMDRELKSNNLAKENNILKFSFDEQLSLNQERHQNALMNDVHDSFGGYIEALKLTLLNKKIKETAVDEILDSFIKDYRLLLNSLHIPNINTENFVGAIQEYCDKMNSLSQINIIFNNQKKGSIEIPQNIAKFIFKASSELTTNAIKYAKPTNINVSLIFDKNHIQLQVKDNGVGFDYTSIKNSSYGINGIRERATNLNGNFNIESEINKYTKINLEIPVH